MILRCVKSSVIFSGSGRRRFEASMAVGKGRYRDPNLSGIFVGLAKNSLLPCQDHVGWRLHECGGLDLVYPNDYLRPGRRWWLTIGYRF